MKSFLNKLLDKYSISKKQDKGFTLFELLFALALFSFLVAIVVSIFSTALKVQRKNLSQQIVQNEVRYATEVMYKEIRMSHVLNDSNKNRLHIKAYKPSGAIVDVVYTRSGNGEILRNGSPVTSQMVNIKRLIFYIGNTANPPAIVTVVVDAESLSPGVKAEERGILQTQFTASLRDYTN